MEPPKDIKILCQPVKAATCSRCGKSFEVSGREPFSTLPCPHCGHKETVPAQFGQFLLLNLLSAGGMGGVYRALDQNLGRFVAIKVMRASFGEDAAFVERFKQEAQAAAKLNHPNVAQIYSFGQEQGQPYIAMEYVAGQRFDRLIEARPEGLDPVFVLRVGLEIAEGLKAADEIGLIHGDIKPGNILLDEKNRAKLVDFGIASYAGKERAEGIWGTPYYIAPEAVQKQKIDARSDIYCLGASLFHALTGHPPFEGATPAEVVAARLQNEPPKLRALKPDLSEKIEEIIARMLQPHPARRYPNYASLTSDLKAALESLAAEQGRMVIGKGGKTVRLQFKKRAQAGGGAAAEAAGAERLIVPRSATEKLTELTRLSEEQEAAERAARRARVRRALVLLAVLCLAGGGAAAGWWGYRRHQEQQRAVFEARRKALELRQAQDKAAGLFEQVQRAAADVRRGAAVVAPLVSRATNILFEVLREAPPAPPAAEAAPPPAATGQTAVAAAATQTNGAPAGPAAAEEATPLAVAAAKLRRFAGQAFEVGRQVEAAVQTAREREAEAARLRDQAARAAQAAEAEASANRLAAILAELQQARARQPALLQNAKDALEVVRLQREEILRLRRQQAQEEEQRQRELQRQNLIAEETGRAGLLPATVEHLIREFRFGEAAQTIRKQLPSYRTAEGRKAVQLVAERYAMIDELFGFLIRSLNEEPFRWGWDRGRGVFEDVLGADKEGVLLRGRQVPWTKVGPNQFLMFVDKYVDVQRAGGASRQGRLLLATAAFLRETGAPALARRYVEKALAVAPHLREEAGLLVPLD